MEAERPRFEVADVVRFFEAEYRRLHGTTPSQKRIMKDILECRTEALGGHINEVDKCITCGFVRQSYNSCRNRHCPKCQGTKRAEWLAGRMQHILPVEYFHTILTLPDLLNPLILGNKKVIYNIIFESASKTLLTLARDPKHFGAQIGITAVLHSWGQNLSFHPHLHCIIPGGGLSLAGDQWVSAKKTGFFLPVYVVGDLFRGKFLDALQCAYNNGELDLGGSVAELKDPRTFSRFRQKLQDKRWVVHIKRTFAGPEQVFRYLGRYTHRVAISNSRIIKIEDGYVTFRYKDYKDGARKKNMILKGSEFLRRFLLHELPKKFTRIRHYGISAGPNVKTKLADAKKLLHVDADDQNQTDDDIPWWERFFELTGIDVMKCPHCGGRMERISMPKTSVLERSPRAPP